MANLLVWGGLFLYSIYSEREWTQKHPSGCWSLFFIFVFFFFFHFHCLILSKQPLNIHFLGQSQHCSRHPCVLISRKGRGPPLLGRRLDFAHIVSLWWDLNRCVGIKNAYWLETIQRQEFLKLCLLLNVNLKGNVSLIQRLFLRILVLEANYF